jgi:hypothetical protein
MVKRKTRAPKQPAKPERPSADSAAIGTSGLSPRVEPIGASDLMRARTPDRVATPEKCRAETVRLFDEIETYQGQAVAKGEAEYIYKRFGDPAGAVRAADHTLTVEDRRADRQESKQSLKRYKKILVRNTFELLQVSMGKDLGTTTAAKKIYKLYPKDFSSVEAVERMLERLGLGTRKGRGKKKPPPT